MVFEAGNDALGKKHYEVHILSIDGGPLKTGSPITLMTESIDALSPESVDTLLISGGDDRGLQEMADDEAMRKWATRAARHARRFGSVCNGTLALAHFGLLSGRRVTTHWACCVELARRYPDVQVDLDAIFVNDGRLWTSAGVTTGIDMSLEMVARDLGTAIANAIAKRLVLHARRPGYHPQFSSVLNAQSQAEGPFASLVEWMRDNLDDPLDVTKLADKMAMSERTFLRRFTKSVGETPARFVETLRLEQARSFLAAGMLLKDIAARTGFATGAHLSRAFDRRFGMSPMVFRELHARVPETDFLQ